MCYHKAVPEKINLKEFVDQFNPNLDLEIDDFHPFYHVSGFSHPRVPVQTSGEPHKVQSYIWGLIPHWSKNREDAVKNAGLYLNTVSEKVQTTYKPFFKQRCLIYVSGFYEWKWANPGAKSSDKTPYFIQSQQSKVFTLGGYYNSWTDRESGELFETYSVITTPANELMATIHNNKKRMPLIIGPSNWDLWLNPDASVEEITSLMMPYEEGYLKAHEISRNITKRGFDTNVPEIQQPVISGELF